MYSFGPRVLQINLNLQWVEWGVRSGEGNVAAYRVQIVNKPDHIIVLKVWRALYIFLPVEYIAELFVKVG